MSKTYIKAKLKGSKEAKISLCGNADRIAALICVEIESVAKNAGISPVELACTIADSISSVHTEGGES